MNKLKELQYKCSNVELKWNNEQWEIIARLPDGSGCYCEGHDVAKVVADALARIEEFTQARANRAQVADAVTKAGLDDALLSWHRARDYPYQPDNRKVPA